MRVIIFINLLFFSFSSVFAQVDRTKAPEPKPAREIKLGEYQSFTLKNGLRVFVVENHKLPRLQFSIQLLHKPVLEGAKAGYVSMAGDLMGTGTTMRTKAQLDEEVDFIGASLSTSASGLFASSLTKHSGKLVELMTDVLYNPSFQQEELDKIKTQTLSGISAGKEDPGTISSNVRRVLLYGKNHPYGELTTEESVKAITLEDCKKYYQEYFKPNNAYLVMVGDVSFKDAKKIAEKNFGRWKPGEIKSREYPVPTSPEKTYVALIDRPASVQSIINIAYPVDLKIGSEEALKARVMNHILGGDFSSRLNQNLREKHGYTYGSGSQLTSDELVGRFTASASVRNEVTDSAVHELLYELKRIASEKVSEKELQAAKASIAGSFGRSLEQPQTIANFAVNTARYNLPKDYYTTFLQRLEAVSAEAVKDIAEKYIRPNNAYIQVVGKGAEIAAGLKRFGEVKYYDIHGNDYTPATQPEIPPGLSATQVIENYLAAIGGREKLKNVKSLKLTYKGEAMGNELTMTVIKVAPDKALLEISAGGMILQKVIQRGQHLAVTSMGQAVEIGKSEMEKLMFEGAIFPELNLEGVSTKISKAENLDGEEAYAIEFSFPSGGKKTQYYGAKSWLKLKQEDKVNSPQGDVLSSIAIAGYQESQGVQFPQQIMQSQGPMRLSFELVEIQVNPSIAETIFK